MTFVSLTYFDGDLGLQSGKRFTLVVERIVAFAAYPFDVPIVRIVLDNGRHVYVNATVEDVERILSEARKS